MARHGIYQKLERSLIESFVYICEGLVLVHRHFLKPRNVRLWIYPHFLLKTPDFPSLKLDRTLFKHALFLATHFWLRKKVGGYGL